MAPGCPRCPVPVAETGDGGWACPDHGEIAPLWRHDVVDYDAFAAHVRLARGMPTYLPWPMSPGWRITDLASAGAPGRPRGTLGCVSGTSELDGPVDVVVVTEEPGTGLGARVAGVPALDPGPEVTDGPPGVQVRIESQQVRLWPASTSEGDGEWDRSVLVGEAGGRWLWLVLRPASAVLLLRDEWILRDVSADGPQAVSLPFGGPGPQW